MIFRVIYVFGGTTDDHRTVGIVRTREPDVHLKLVHNSANTRASCSDQASVNSRVDVDFDRRLIFLKIENKYFVAIRVRKIVTLKE